MSTITWPISEGDAWLPAADALIVPASMHRQNNGPLLGGKLWKTVPGPPHNRNSKVTPLSPALRRESHRGCRSTNHLVLGYGVGLIPGLIKPADLGLDPHRR